MSALALAVFFLIARATTVIYTLSLHDALPIFSSGRSGTHSKFLDASPLGDNVFFTTRDRLVGIDRKSTRLNSSHGYISYAVFCLKKKNSKTRWRRYDIPLQALAMA